MPYIAGWGVDTDRRLDHPVKLWLAVRNIIIIIIIIIKRNTDNPKLSSALELHRKISAKNYKQSDTVMVKVNKSYSCGGKLKDVVESNENNVKKGRSKDCFDWQKDFGLFWFNSLLRCYLK